MIDCKMNLEVLNLGISTLLTRITLNDEVAPEDDTLLVYQPHLRAIVRELQAFEGTYRDDTEEGEDEDEDEERTTDGAAAPESREAIIHAHVRQYPVVSLLDSDTPERTLQLLSCTSSLLEFLTWLNGHPCAGGSMYPYRPELADIACEATEILEECVMNVVSDNRHGEQEYLTGLEQEESTGRLGRLSVALMACINEISRRDDRELNVWLDDLMELAQEMSMAFRRSARQALPVDDGFL